MTIGRVLVAAAVALLAWTAAVACSGGIDLRVLGIPLTARAAWPTLAAAMLAALAAWSGAGWRRAAILEDLGWLAQRLHRLATPLALALAALAAGFAVSFGAFVAGGSDSYCYVEQAERLAAGTFLAPVDFGFDTPWDQAALSLAPTGFVPSRVVPGAIAPICPAGLALVMAMPRALGAPRSSVFYVVPLFAGLAVWAAFLVGRRLGGASVGLATAALTATSPIALYQAEQPMSDIPATALWLAALALVGRRTKPTLGLAGLSAGMAAMMRPNLAPLAMLFAAAAWARHGNERGSTRARAARAAAVLAGVVPAAVAVGLMQWLAYGSPLRSGYGSLDALFRLSHVVPNLGRYVPWLLQTQSPLVLAAAAAPWLAGRTGRQDPRIDALLLAGFALGVMCAYLPYVPFDDWWYLRFWLPAIPPLIALATAVLARLATLTLTRWPRRTAQVAGGAMAAVGLVATVALGAWQLGVARDRGVFRLAESERKFTAAGQYVESALPASAVVLTVWHSGAVRYYGHRPSLVWDAIVAGQLPAVVEALERQGREPFLLLEDWERDAFRARFAGQPLAALDWPPRARIGRQVSIWALADRARFLRGDTVRSDRIW